MPRFPQMMINVKVREAIRSQDRSRGARTRCSKVAMRLGSEGRVVLRASGTEPVIRVMVEGRDETDTRCAAPRKSRPWCAALRPEGRAAIIARPFLRPNGPTTASAHAPPDHRRKLENARLARRERRAGRGHRAQAAERRPKSGCARRSSICRKWAARCAGSRISLGAQDVCAETQGAFTGEVSAAMLQGRGLRRRRSSAIPSGARSVRRDRSAGGAQIRRGAGRRPDPDPVRGRAARRARGGPHLRSGGSPARCRARAVGRRRRLRAPSSRTSRCGPSAPARRRRPQQAEEVHAHIRARIAGRDAKIAALVRIQYGGSVKAANAAELFAMPERGWRPDRRRLAQGRRIPRDRRRGARLSTR